MPRRKSFERFVTSSSLVTGAAAVLCGTDQADAVVVPFTPPGGPIVLHPLIDGGPYYSAIDFDGDTQIDFFINDLSYFGGFYLHPWRSFQNATNLIMNDGTVAAVVAPGASVGPDTTGWPHTASLDNFLGTRGYAGVVFDIPGGSPHFGYLDLSFTADRSTLILYGGAYESLANTPIQTPIPEPGSLVLLASGAAGLTAWRRKRPRTSTTSDK